MGELKTAKEIYEMLINKDKILSLTGQIRFFLGNTNIVVAQRDVVGNVIQEWVAGWMTDNGIFYRPNPNTQMPPDFYLLPDNDNENLLEIKAFNMDATPAFDIADFNMYINELIEKPWTLDTDYLIFGYSMDKEGNVTIKNLWLKKVWEISRRMENWSINLQIKDNVVHKIRPGVWYGNQNNLDYPVFTCIEDFISAINECVYKNPKTHNMSGNWLDEFIKSYTKHYKKKIVIPKWMDIERKYDNKTKKQIEKLHERFNSNKKKICNLKEKMLSGNLHEDKRFSLSKQIQQLENDNDDITLELKLKE